MDRLFLLLIFNHLSFCVYQCEFNRYLEIKEKYINLFLEQWSATQKQNEGTQVSLPPFKPESFEIFEDAVNCLQTQEFQCGEYRLKKAQEALHCERFLLKETPEAEVADFGFYLEKLGIVLPANENREVISLIGTVFQKMRMIETTGTDTFKFVDRPDLDEKFGFRPDPFNRSSFQFNPHYSEEDLIERILRE